jgi:hypothetical protein
MANEEILRKIRANYSKVRQDISSEPIPGSQTSLTSDKILKNNRGEETMIIARAHHKRSEVASGFFGWILFDNLAFSLLFLILLSLDAVRHSGGNGFGIIASLVLFGMICLFMVIKTIALLIKKRVWVFLGIGLALMANFVLWLILLGDLVFYGTTIMFVVVPCPMGFFVFRS